MTVIAMAAVGITAVMPAVQFKAMKGEYRIYLTAAACLFIFSYGIRRMDTILEGLRRIQEYIKIDQVYLTALIKMIGIAYVAEFSSGICRDSGYSAIGTQIEIFGKLSILAVSMPIILALLETLEGFLS